MTDGQELPEEFTKKQKENMICSHWRKCASIYSCRYAKPHQKNHECGIGHRSQAGIMNRGVVTELKCSACIQIPDMWLDKGGE